jgi:hypothetical protein
MPIITYYSSDKKEEDLMDGACDTYGGEQKLMQSFVGNPEGKRPLERPKRRRDNGIKIYASQRNWMVGCKLDSSVSLQGPVARS